MAVKSESVLIHFGFKGSFQPFGAALEVGVRHFNADSLIAFLHSGQHGGARPGKGVKDAPARLADLHHIPHKLQGFLGHMDAVLGIRVTEHAR